MSREEFQVQQVSDNSIKMIAVILLSFSAFGIVAGWVSTITAYWGDVGEMLSQLLFLAGFVYLVYFWLFRTYATGLVVIESGTFELHTEKPGLFLPAGIRAFAFDDLEHYQLATGKGRLLCLEFRGGQRYHFTNKWQVNLLFEYLEKTIPEKKRNW